VIDTFSPPVPPQTGSSFEIEDNDIVLQFGDGYKQVVGNGINTTRQTFSLSWSYLKYEEYTEIYNFFLTHSHGVVFYWTLPHEDTPRKWRKSNTKIAGSTPTQTTYSLTVQIEEAFDLDV
jgi:phage-related protein